jgi:hypothetical protein
MILIIENVNNFYKKLIYKKLITKYLTLNLSDSLLFRGTFFLILTFCHTHSFNAL